MKYPYIFWGGKISQKPVFANLQGAPFILDLSAEGKLMDGLRPREQAEFQERLDQAMQNAQCSWGVAAYLENREVLLSDCPQMVQEQRFFHLGLDVIVPLGTPLHAPLDAVVQESGYEAGEGNYGGYVLLKHEGDRFETFYSLYGHLCKTALPEAGQSFAAGEAFAKIGDFHENGNWFYHTHIQVITEHGLAQGYVSKGYCSKDDLAVMDGVCPSPLSLFLV